MRDPRTLLAIEADAWRRVVLAASERLVLVVPASVRGEVKSPHPLSDEIATRLRLDEATAARITRTATAVLRDASSLVPTREIPRLHLPDARGHWTIAPPVLVARDNSAGLSATSLERLASCPLSWVLAERARLRSGAVSRVASGPLLFGSLTHRLVEVLHQEGAFELPEVVFVERVRSAFETLLEREGATLLLQGSSFERIQLTAQVVRALRELHRYLAASGFKIAAVEEVVETTSPIGILRGRLDVRLVDAEGRSAILDLKWGASTYRELLAEGRAVQLAVYARGVTASTRRTSLAPAAYFALGAGQILAADERMKAPRRIDGPTLDVTLSRVEATIAAVLSSHAQGKVFVAATKKSLPLLDALGIPETAQTDHYGTEERDVPCSYCSYDAICGRRWEVLA